MQSTRTTMQIQWKPKNVSKNTEQQVRSDEQLRTILHFPRRTLNVQLVKTHRRLATILQLFSSSHNKRLV